MTIWLAQVDIAGYQWTVVGSSAEECEQALLTEYREQQSAGHIFDVGAGSGSDATVESLRDHHGVRLYEMTPGKVEWL